MTETASKSDLSALLERVREAKGASLDLDLAIEQAVGPFPDRLVDNYTQSIDAALALVERVLPGWTWNIDSLDRVTLNEDGWYWASVRTPSPFNATFYRDTAPKPALAILAALLGALIAKEQGDE